MPVWLYVTKTKCLTHSVHSRGRGSVIFGFVILALTVSCVVAAAVAMRKFHGALSSIELGSICVSLVILFIIFHQKTIQYIVI